MLLEIQNKVQVNRVGNIDIHAQNLHMPQLKEELKEKRCCCPQLWMVSVLLTCLMNLMLIMCIKDTIL